MNPNWLQKSIKDAKEALNKVSDWSRGMSSIEPFKVDSLKREKKKYIVYELSVKQDYDSCAITYLFDDFDLAEKTKKEFLARNYELVFFFPRNVYEESPIYQ